MAKIDRVMVWICFRGLNLFYYDESILSTLASVVGRSIKVDSNTKGVWRGHFACVEIDLMKPVVGNIWLKDFWCKVEYESIHRICSNYGCYGHLTREFLYQPTVKEEESNNPDGSLLEKLLWRLDL